MYRKKLRDIGISDRQIEQVLSLIERFIAEDVKDARKQYDKGKRDAYDKMHKFFTQELDN